MLEIFPLTPEITHDYLLLLLVKVLTNEMIRKRNNKYRKKDKNCSFFAEKCQDRKSVNVQQDC